MSILYLFFSSIVLSLVARVWQNDRVMVAAAARVIAQNGLEFYAANYAYTSRP
jgi:hypothetical protein